MRAWNSPIEDHERLRHSRLPVDHVRTATIATFDDLVSRATGPVAVEFMSYGCAHCRAMEPSLQEVAAEIAVKETIFRVNIAVDQELADRYEIQGTPTFIMFLDGREIARSEGPSPTRRNIIAVVTRPFEQLNEF
jgi:thiol-disulfide isomerase/thioredoxin